MLIVHHLLLLTMIVYCLALGIGWLVPRVRRLEWRFSVRIMLIAVTLAGVVLGMASWSVRTYSEWRLEESASLSSRVPPVGD
jgi:Ca2+/Na+ antiporter